MPKRVDPETRRLRDELKLLEAHTERLRAERSRFVQQARRHDGKHESHTPRWVRAVVAQYDAMVISAEAMLEELATKTTLLASESPDQETRS